MHDLKQMSEVYGESRLMIPQVLMQLREAREKLFSLLGTGALRTSVDPPSPYAEMFEEANMRFKEACEVLQDDFAPIHQVPSPDIDSDSSEY